MKGNGFWRVLHQEPVLEDDMPKPGVIRGGKEMMRRGFFFFFFFPPVFLGPHPQPMEVPRLGVESELYCWPWRQLVALPDP